MAHVIVLRSISKIINNRNWFDLRYGTWQTVNSVENAMNSFRLRAFFQRPLKFHAVKCLFKLYVCLLYIAFILVVFLWTGSLHMWSSACEAVVRTNPMKYSKIKSKLSDIWAKIYIETEAQIVTSIFNCTFSTLCFRFIRLFIEIMQSFFAMLYYAISH